MAVLSVSTTMFHQWKWGETQVPYQFSWIKGLLHQRICPNLSCLGTGSGANLLIHYRFTHRTLHLHLAEVQTNRNTETCGILENVWNKDGKT